MKLNLGCGQDFRINYTNIDKHPVDTKYVQYGDFTNLNLCGISDNSVEEMVCVDGLSYIPNQKIVEVLTNWVTKMAPDGELFIQTFDGSVLGNMMGYSQVGLEQSNEFIYGNPQDKEPRRALYTLPYIESILKNLKLTTVEKGISSVNFYIRAKKLVTK